MIREHTPSDAFPSPGETNEEFMKRIKALGITDADRPKNVSNY